MAQHITNPQEIKSLGRPLGKHISDAQITAYIDEVENMYVKPILGDALYLSLIPSDETTDTPADSDDDVAVESDDTSEDLTTVLLNGGTYYKDDVLRSLAGLKTAISYFVYAQNIMCGDFQSTRYGMVVKDGDYSTHLSSKERSDAYNNALEVGNRYLQECVAYCKAFGLLPSGKRNVAAAGSVRIRKIG